MTNLPTTKTRVSAPSMLMDPSGFDQLYRVGKMLASSVLFPQHLREGTPEQAAANGALVMNMAMRLNEDPLTIAQQIYFVGGKPGWSTSYLISKANQHGVFENPIDWRIQGEGDSLSVTAFAKLAQTKKEVSFTCDMAMARAENWVKNPKYKSMPELMLRYRSAAALIRLYCPEVMVGVPAQIEVELNSEMRDITPQEFRHAAPARDEAPEKSEALDADVVEDEAPTDEPDPSTEDAPEPERAAKSEGGKSALEGAPKATPDPAQYQGLVDMIKRDLADAPRVQDVIDLYGPQIEGMKAVVPDLHKDLVEEIEAYRQKESDE